MQVVRMTKKDSIVTFGLVLALLIGFAFLLSNQGKIIDQYHREEVILNALARVALSSDLPPTMKPGELEETLLVLASDGKWEEKDLQLMQQVVTRAKGDSIVLVLNGYEREVRLQDTTVIDSSAKEGNGSEE
jgi:hypothetical protein